MKTRKPIKAYFFVLLLTVAAFFGCVKTETETYQTDPLSAYLPLQPGKYITYRTDSTVFVNFGTNTVVRSYQEKHVVEARVTDNLDRPSFRVFRYLRDAAGTQPWTPSGIYLITPTEKKIEVIENNLRFVKLVLPLKKNVTWKGNQFLPDKPLSSQFPFGNDNFMQEWDYRIDSTDMSVNLNGKTYNNVLQVVGRDVSNLIDTINVTGTQVQIPTTLNGAFLRGSASGAIVINALPPSSNKPTLMIYNRTNQAASLGNITIPPDGAKLFEYLNNNWTFGYVNGRGERKDTVYLDLPYGSKDLLVEQYAKGIGPVYQELVMWEYQPNPGGNGGYKNGFGVKRSVIDHN